MLGKKKEEKPKFVAKVMGRPDSRAWEVSVCKEDYKRGMVSFGGFNSEKIFISASPGSPCDPVLFEGLLKLAEHHAKYLNDRAKDN